jgi:hypothetical protein
MGVNRCRGMWGAFILCIVGSFLATPSASIASCPNEAFRTGASAHLPDCRAYEMVSPADTNGRTLTVPSSFGLGGIPFNLFPIELASPVRASFVFQAANGALATPGGGGGAYDLYRASREAAGWKTVERLTPTPSDRKWLLPGGVSADHQYAFANAPSGNFLRKPGGAFDPLGLGNGETEPYAQGRYISEGGTHVIFSTGSAKKGQSGWCLEAGPACKVQPLAADAPAEGTGAVYDRPADGPPRVVSLFPGGGTPDPGENAFYKGNSRDGTTIAFTIGETLYVRVKSGEPGEETLKVAEGAEDKLVFAGISDEGRYLFYVAAGNIYRFDTTDGSAEQVNSSGDGMIVNVSADGSHVYFISEQQLDGGKGTAGQPNMYVWSADATRYITTVAQTDLEGTSGPSLTTGVPALTTWTSWVTNPVGPFETEGGPGADSSRTTPNGHFLVFESRARLTSYDNAGHTEIYRYDDSAPGLSCVSCNPTAEPATSDARLQELPRIRPQVILHNLSDDGTRVFFETAEALASEDTDGINDVYEWQETPLGGPPSLISSGKTIPYTGPAGFLKAESKPNTLFSITPDGSDVFFSAPEALVPGAGDHGTQVIYDARVGGGFPSSPAAQACSEEGCRSLSGPGIPAFPGGGSEATAGSGNVKPKRHRCHRGKKHRKGCPKGHRHRPPARGSSVAAATGDPAANSGPSSSSTATASDDSQPGRSSQVTTTPGALACGGTEEFGIERWEAGLSDPAAGAHPDFRPTVEFNHVQLGGDLDACAAIEKAAVHLPPGLLGNPQAVPACETGEFVALANCSADSQVGVTRVRVGNPSYRMVTEPIYNLTPAHQGQEVARLGFWAILFPVFINIRVDTAGDYGATATIEDPPGQGVVISAKTVLWGNPSGSSHDEERLTYGEALDCPSGKTCHALGGKRPSSIPPGQRKTFMTNPSACQEGSVGLSVTSYQLPGQVFTADAPLAPITGCTGLPFAPSFEAEPTSHAAGAPTGLKTKLVIPQHLLEGERATATMREARVTLPAGMQVAAGAANWIGTCSEGQVGYHEEVDTACPDSSKLGTAKIVSPDLPEPIEGTIYQRSPRPGHQLGLWLTADALGLHVKLPGELEPDPKTGRLTAVFRDLPQVPVEEIDLDVWGGPRAPLQNPDHCGSFATGFSFTPHSDDPAVTGQSTMQITEGCNQGFNPALKAGVTEPVAGKFSPFVFDLSRPDGDQALRGFELHLPDGELAKVAGVPLCPDPAASSASCPQGSRIGSLQATTGPGPDPFTLPAPGKAQPQVYLAGPYQGSPFSIVSEVPAQAGPFDLGTLAVRSGLAVEPETGVAVVKADPLPQFFEGVGIAYRNIHAVIDRPEFNLNPTDCSQMAVTADATSTQGAVAHPQARFQVGGCKALKFKPRLTLELKGGTKRASYPALTAVLKARKGDANIASASVALPHSEFLAQEHIGTICTRVQFAAGKCPKGSVYGRAKAWTPLLEKPLSGPVYLRSSNNPLPDLVAKLGGQLEIDLVGRIDSVHGGIRTTFESVPDAPVSKFVLQMRGGQKSLLTNSTDICHGPHRATAQFKAQNGRTAQLRPALVASGCGKKKLGKHRKHH